MTRDSIHIVPTKTDAEADASGFSEAPQMSFEISFDEFDDAVEAAEPETSSCAGRQGSSSLLLFDPEASPRREGPTQDSSGNNTSPLLRNRLFRTAKKVTSNEVPSKPSKQRHFHLRPTFHRLSTPAKKECEDTDPPAVTRSSSSTTTDEPTDTELDHESNISSSPSNHENEVAAEENANNKDNAKEDDSSESGLMLFKDERDIVAFQEWPPQRRLRYFHPLQQSPSSVCGFSVETIATKLGRSPVVVSFDKDFPRAFENDENSDDQELPEGASNAVSIKGRIGTGRFPRAGEPPTRMDSEDEMVEMPTELDRDMVFNHHHNSRDPNSTADSFLNVIESTLFHMMCLD